MLVSIYLPTKNRLHSLKHAIQSVLDQTHSDWELLVVNDGSTDGTAAYLAGLALSEPRIRVVNLPESVGGCAARNVAIERASGEMLTGLDDDDYFAPQRLASLVRAWEAFAREGCSPSCLYTQISEVQEGRVVHVSRKPASCVAEDMFIANVVGSQIFAPKHVYVEAGLFDPRMPAWQDLEFYIRVLKRFGPARLVDEPSYFFENSVRPDRISLRSSLNIRRAFNLVCELHAQAQGRRIQALYLQLFSKVYGVRPTWSDVCRFMSLGFWGAGTMGLLKAVVRNRWCT